jgi:hypothetical protein
MVSLFITAFAFALAILFLAGIGFYLWPRSGRQRSAPILPPNPDFYGLFAEAPSKTEGKVKELVAQRELAASNLIDRARQGDRSVLTEAKATSDAVYDRALGELLEHAASDAALLSLMSYVAQNDLPVNRGLARAVSASWRKSPDRANTAKALHFAALSDEADIYGETVEETMRFWREGKLPELSKAELRALFDGEFWILSARTRSSGAGFVLKRTLDSARRELETGARIKQ